MGSHLGSRAVVQPTVSRKHPFETVGEQSGHRLDLPSPGIPTGIAECNERFPLRRPGQVIAREEDLIAIQENLVALGMTRRRKTQKVRAKNNGLLARGHMFDLQAFGSVSFVHDPRTAKVSGKFCMVGDVVSMREKYLVDTAHAFDLFHERPCEAR